MIAIDNMSVHAGAFALDGVSFCVPAAGYAVLMGKTGCGKTTILEAICGLRRLSAGVHRHVVDGDHGCGPRCG